MIKNIQDPEILEINSIMLAHGYEVDVSVYDEKNFGNFYIIYRCNGVFLRIIRDRGDHYIEASTNKRNWQSAFDFLENNEKNLQKEFALSTSTATFLDTNIDKLVSKAATGLTCRKATPNTNETSIINLYNNRRKK
jgi:hypothetical protein